jgi:AmiR/NasT family two-component response regulator
MPVIEQAKGILIAQTGCSPEEAFALLRQASQRSNVRVSELAASIVDRAVTKGRPRPAEPPG